MRWAALVLVACGGSAPPPPPAHTGGAPPPPPPPAVTCAEVAGHIAQIAVASPIHDDLVATIRDRCTADEWSVEARTCVRGERVTVPRLAHCYGRYLSAVQNDALRAAMAALATRPITTQLPTASNLPTATAHPSIVVGLAHDGTTTVDSVKLSGADLDKALATAAQIDPLTQVVIAAPLKATTTDVNDIVTRVKAAGLANIVFAVTP